MLVQEVAKARLTAEEVFTKSQEWGKRLDSKSPDTSKLSDKDLYNLITDVVAIRFAYGLNRSTIDSLEQPYVTQIIYNNAKYMLYSPHHNKPDIAIITKYERGDFKIEENLKIIKKEKDGIERYSTDRMFRSSSLLIGNREWIAYERPMSKFEAQNWAQAIWRAHVESLLHAEKTRQLVQSPQPSRP